MNRTLNSLVAALALLSAGCSGGTPTATLETFIAEYCTVLAPCCDKAGLPTNGAQCRALFTNSAAQAGAYDPAKGAACLEEYKAAAKQPDFCTNSALSNSTQSCGDVFEGAGTKQPGEACEEDNECIRSSKGEVECEHYWVGSAEARLCQVRMVGKEGDKPCVGTVDGNLTMGTLSSDKPPSEGYLCNRANGVYCDGDGKAGCLKIQTTGGVCTGSASCDPVSYCDYSKKQCLARVAVGATCDTFDQNCEKTANCDSTSKKCVAKLAEGAACTSSAACVTDSCVNGKCAKSSGLESLAWKMICG